jgi:hypothetical protein
MHIKKNISISKVPELFVGTVTIMRSSHMAILAAVKHNSNSKYGIIFTLIFSVTAVLLAIMCACVIFLDWNFNMTDHFLIFGISFIQIIFS